MLAKFFIKMDFGCFPSFLFPLYIGIYASYSCASAFMSDAGKHIRHCFWDAFLISMYTAAIYL